MEGRNRTLSVRRFEPRKTREALKTVRLMETHGDFATAMQTAVRSIE